LIANLLQSMPNTKLCGVRQILGRPARAWWSLHTSKSTPCSLVIFFHCFSFHLLLRQMDQ